MKNSAIFPFLLDTENIDIDITLILDGSNVGGGRVGLGLGSCFVLSKGILARVRKRI